MFNVVIVGAGALGRYLASLLSREKHNVIVVDNDKKKLEELSWDADVATREGEGTDWQLLEELLELSPQLLLSLTHSDQTNLITCSIAKHLGYPTTVARIHDNRFLNRTRLDFARLFHVDHFISPELLTANEIIKSVLNKGAFTIDYFSHGAVQLCTLRIPANWKEPNQPLSHLDLPNGIMVGLISRKGEKGEEVLFPHGQDVLLPHDEVTFIGETEAMDAIYGFFGLEHKAMSSVVIIGGSLTAIQLAKLLGERQVSVRLIEKKYERCLYLADQLPNATILNGDGFDLDFLKAEKIVSADLIVACTRHDEKNLVLSMLAKEVGCEYVMMVLYTGSYRPILDKLDIGHVVSPLTISADRILSHIFAKTFISLVSLYENRAEVLEVKVSPDSKIVGIPLSDLGPLLPKDFLIAIIQSRGRIMVAHGDRIISPGDTVIVITNPKHIPVLEALF